MRYLNNINYKSRVQYDLINKFNYKNIQELPKLDKLHLSLSIKKVDINILVASLVALELLSNQRGQLIKSKTLNTMSKVQKGNPIGSKVTLRKEKLFKFLLKLKLRDNIYVFPKSNKKNLSFQIKNLMFFKEIETNYHFFKKLNCLNVTINMTSLTREEGIFLLMSYGINLKYCRNNLRVECNLAKVKVRVRFSFFA